MIILAKIFTVLVGVEALYICYLEMFQATSAQAQKTFELSLAFLQQKNVQILMGNQGLYNGFIGVGILVGVFAMTSGAQQLMLLLFTGFVIVAAIYGGLTASKKILYLQGLPALIAFVLLWWL